MLNFLFKKCINIILAYWPRRRSSLLPCTEEGRHGKHLFFLMEFVYSIPLNVFHCLTMYINIKSAYALFTIAHLRKEPSCPTTDEWIKMWYISTMEYYAAIKKWNPAICNDVDGTRGYYAERNKSIRERQLSYDLSDMRILRGRVGVMGRREGEKKPWWD